MTDEVLLEDADREVDELAERVRRLLGPFATTEVALDVGCGRGALTRALARFCAEVIGVDADAEALAAARATAPENVRFVEGDVTRLPFPFASFDIAACRGLLHRVRRPELVVSELARVTRLGGRLLVVDELGAIDPLRSLEMDKFLRLQDPTHRRLLPDADIRGYLDANDLVLVSHEVVRHRVDSRTGGDGGAPGLQGPTLLELEVGWYVARKPVPT